MPGFQDSAFLIVLALLLFGPKKLPQLARQAGKLMADFRRASNEFRTQMEEELRISEQADRQKQVAALEAAKPPATTSAAPEPTPAPSSESTSAPVDEYRDPYMVDNPYDPVESTPSIASATESSPDPAPIATSGELSIMPPATGLPIANSAPATGAEASAGGPPGGNATEHSNAPPRESELETETLHG
jgi:sec-independent protein translocase protein TatB